MSTQPVVTTITVAGMSCAHCVSAVTAEMSKLEGVAAVDVDLASGRVRVESDRELAASAIAEAIDEAGYEVVG